MLSQIVHQPNLAYAKAIAIAFKMALAITVVVHTTIVATSPTPTTTPLTTLEMAIATVDISFTISTLVEADSMMIFYTIMEKEFTVKSDLVATLIHMVKR